MTAAPTLTRAVSAQTATDTTLAAAPAQATVANTMADPAGLGLGAFALTTFVLSLANAGLVPEAGAAVLALALFYGGLLQVAAGLLEFFKGNTFGATAFCSYGGFWMALWWLETNPAMLEKAGSAGLGAFLLAWTIFTLYMTIVSLRTNGVLIATFSVVFLTFVALTIGAFTGGEAIHRLGGWLGLLAALLAWYGSFAVVLNATWKRQVLPMWAK